VAPSIGAIDAFNDIRYVLKDAQLRFDALPLEGQTKRVPWTDTYWPKNEGGISNRWKTGETHGYTSPTPTVLKTMSVEEIGDLSPTEKYDILCGNYSYPLTSAVQAQNRKTTAGWQGYCHGWATAALHFPEPQPITVTNDHGIAVPFGSSDIKALLTFFQGEIVRTQFSKMQHPFKAETRSIGGNNLVPDALCELAYDVNPGSFHAMLGNLIGERHEGFVIDRDNGPQKWNQPVHRYQSTVLATRPPSPGAAPTAVSEKVVYSDVTYRLEVPPRHEPAGDSVGNHTERYHYTVELDANGFIVGGQWLAKTEGDELVRYHEVHDHLVKEGLSKKEIWAAMQEIFRIPDYAYTQEKGELSDEFVPAASSYAFLSQDKKKLWHYFAKLSLLLGD